MKKRNLARRHGKRLARLEALDGVFARGPKKRKVWSFEHLEDRHYFSATPFQYQSGMNGLLNSDQVALNELYWSVKQAGALGQYDQAALAAATSWVVMTNLQGAASGATLNDLEMSVALSEIDTTGMSVSQVVNSLNNDPTVLGYYPLISKTPEKEAFSFLDEPLFPLQWNLQNTGGVNIGNPDYQEIFGVPGEDANVVGAWNRGYSGEGVVVAVVDTGIQFSHPDLVDNLNTALATIITPFDPHGTAVAGIIAGDGDNGYGITGVAPNAEIIPMSFQVADELIFGYRNDYIDIYNHSWGPAGGTRLVRGPSAAGLAAIRQSVVFGRPVDGVAKGVIHVFASGNSNGHFGTPGFPNSGNYDSAQFDGYINRYTIGVGGIDHDGKYFNVDGTLTNYPETGANVLIVAPTGSNQLSVSIDTGTGSGIYTSDMTGDLGYNISPLPNGFELDADFLDNTDFTSRFNGTSAADPVVSGIVALMLEANPQLNYRDVQEILMRSARYVDPTNEGWETNFMEPFQDPAGFGIPLEDPYIRVDVPVNAVALQNPFGFGFPSNATATLMLKPIDDYTYQSLPQFTNGAGYTVNYARGVFQEETGWAHGVVDAELAVRLAEQWHSRGQDNLPEVTYTSFVRPLGGTVGVIKAAEFSGPQGNPNLFVIPGSFGDGPRTFGAYYDEFWAQMPFSGMTIPVNDRGIGMFLGASTGSALPMREPNLFEGFEPPLMEIEWVELKVEANGDADAFNELRIAIKSPDGTISELTHFLENNTSTNINNIDKTLLTTASSYSDGGSLIWTFSTNRHWGERTDDVVEIDPTTGLPRIDPDNLGMLPGRFYLDTVNRDLAGNPTFASHITHNWEIIAENYGGADITFSNIEFVFHGQLLPENSERIQGKIGIDRDQDGNFNWFRELAPIADVNGDGVITELDNDIVDAAGLLGGTPDGIIDIREIDGVNDNPEKFGANLVVQAFDKTTGQVVGEFITGADGNFYFDLPSNDVVATSGPVQAQNSTFTVSAGPNGIFSGNAGNGITVTFTLDNTVIGAEATYDAMTNTVEVLVQNETVPWQTIEAAIEAINGGGDFVVSVTNPSGTFDDLDQSLAPTLSGGADGGYDIKILQTSLDEANLDVKQDGGLDPRYRTIWSVRIDPSDNFTRYAGRRVAVDTNRDGIQDFVDANMNGIQDPGEMPIHRFEEFRDVNFLLDPGTPPEQQIDISGFVFADVNGNGVVDGADTRAAQFRVYADMNNSGRFDVGEPTDLVDPGENGEWDLVVPVTALTNVKVRAESLLEGWTPTVPVGGVFSVFGAPGDNFTGIQFGFRPPVNPDPDDPPTPGNDPGVVLGNVFNDEDGDGVRDALEDGVGGIRAYVDVNQNGVFDPSEPNDVTDNSGSYFIEEVTPGSLRIRVETPQSWQLTSPVSGFRAIVLGSAGTISNVNFGLENLATRDFGDLPDSYQTLEGSGGPTHVIVPGFQLGLKIDGEIAGQPTSQANGDDALDDEDGVVVLSNNGFIVSGTNVLQVTVFGVGGYLTGWIDWENDGFEASDRIIWRDQNGNVLGGDILLPANTHVLQVMGPPLIHSGQLAARFRWGENGLNFFGAADHGEVEDYYFNMLVGDYDNNGAVDMGDYVLYREKRGTVTVLPNDQVGGIIGQSHYMQWRANFGKTRPIAGAGASLGEGSASAAAVSPAESQPALGSGISAGSSLVEFPQEDAPQPVETSRLTNVFTVPAQASPLAPALSVTLIDEAVATSVDSDADLLLLDQAWAELDQPAGEDLDADAPLYDRANEEDDSVSELALASLFEDDSSWWSR